MLPSCSANRGLRFPMIADGSRPARQLRRQSLRLTAGLFGRGHIWRRSVRKPDLHCDADRWRFRAAAGGGWATPHLRCRRPRPFRIGRGFAWQLIRAPSIDQLTRFPSIPFRSLDRRPTSGISRPLSRPPCVLGKRKPIGDLSIRISFQRPYATTPARYSARQAPPPPHRATAATPPPPPLPPLSPPPPPPPPPPAVRRSSCFRPRSFELTPQAPAIVASGDDARNSGAGASWSPATPTRGARRPTTRPCRTRAPSVENECRLGSPPRLPTVGRSFGDRWYRTDLGCASAKRRAVPARPPSTRRDPFIRSDRALHFCGAQCPSAHAAMRFLESAARPRGRSWPARCGEFSSRESIAWAFARASDFGDWRSSAR